MDSRLPASGSEGNIGPIAKASFSGLTLAERYDPKGRTSQRGAEADGRLRVLDCKLVTGLER